MAEKWDVYDSFGNLTGKTVYRGKSALAPKEYHLVVHIWIISKKGNFLIQRRSDNKKLMPGEWAATGGAAIAGENSFNAAKRELFEELGIATDEDTLIKIARFKKRNSFIDVYATLCDTPAEKLKLQKSEVAAAKWVSEGTLRKMISENGFHNYGKEYFDCLFSKINEFRRVTV